MLSIPPISNQQPKRWIENKIEKGIHREKDRKGDRNKDSKRDREKLGGDENFYDSRIVFIIKIKYYAFS